MGQHYSRPLMYCSTHIGTYSTDVTPIGSLGSLGSLVGLGRRLRPTGSPLLHEQCRDGQGSHPWPFHLLSDSTSYSNSIFYIPTIDTFFYLRARLYGPHPPKLRRPTRRWFHLIVFSHPRVHSGCLLSTSIFSTARIATREDSSTKFRIEMELLP